MHRLLILPEVFFLLYSLCRSEQGLELDLFLLQCCAAIGPADRYVTRILERFELSDYLSLNLECSNEYATHPSSVFNEFHYPATCLLLT